MDAENIQPILKKSAVIFSNMPILCPWITSQPYQSAVKIKNKLNDLENKNQTQAAVHNTLQQQTTESDLPTPSNYGFPVQESSSHFFYFLRLMQLFPETHPATIHTVLTLTKNNFFHAIDKLLYAKKCKTAYGKRNAFKTRNNNSNKNVVTAQKKVPEQVVANENLNYQQSTINHLEEETIMLDGSPYELEPVSKDKPSDLSTQVFEICVNENGQSKQFDLTKLNDQEVIEIVCFENEYDQKNQGFRKNFMLDNRIEESGRQVMDFGQNGLHQAATTEEQKGGEIFLHDTEDLTCDHQNFEDKMDLEPDIDPDLIKINTRPQVSEVSGKMECYDEFQNIIE